MENQKKPKDAVNLLTEIWTSEPVSREFHSRLCILLPGIGLSIDREHYDKYDNRLFHHDTASKHVVIHISTKGRYKGAILPGINLNEEQLLESIRYTIHIQSVYVKPETVLRKKRRV